MPNDIFDSSESKNTVQLWLDLRQTTISPQTALLHLTNDLWGEYIPPNNKSFIVDKVLVNHSDNLGKIADDLSEEFESEVSLLSFIQSKDEVSEIKSEGVITPFGKLVNVRDEVGKGVININVDPMPVLNTVSSGRWAILDIKEGIESKSVSNLVELASNSAGALRTLGTSFEDPLLSPGGIAISCDTQSDVVEIGALVESLIGGQGFETTDSGILVQSSTMDNNSKKNSENLGFAIVMKFDSVLWKTSSFVFGAIEAPPQE